jgi:pyrroline-5-carboxylate reductase
MKKIAFIGGGNMAGAMVTGLLKTKTAGPKDICVSDPNVEAAVTAGLFRSGLFKGIKTTADNREAADFADIIFLTIKPQIYEQVLPALKNLQNKTVVSVAPGITADAVAELIRGGSDREVSGRSVGASVKIIRVMPNTPASVGAGVTALCRGAGVPDAEFAFVKKIFESVGSVYELPEAQMDAAVALSGSGPAYAYMLLEAMASHGAKNGIPYDTALKAAAETVAGAARMVLETGEQPAALMQKVMSPGGTTEKAVEKLRELHFPETAAAAMDACTARAKELKK